MLIFYPPRVIYQKEVTFMELVCASPCFTAMACFSLEKKRLGERAMDQDAFMPRHRLVARGNATTFPLAWENLLQGMQEAAAQAAASELALPRVGKELADFVNVIIKAGNHDETMETMAKIIHQARVRRGVVLELLKDAQAREHPANKNVCLANAALRAEDLPEDGAPPEIIALLAHDDDLENIQRQKAATPVRDNLRVEDVQQEFACMTKPNAVVNERTSAGFEDANAQCATALRTIAAQSDKHAAEEGFVIHTGNRLLDQFEPWYFAFAFAFLFSYGTAMPDPPNWSAKPRHRRPDSAPASTSRPGCDAWRVAVSRR